MVDLGRLRSFVVVAEELHVRRAAERLHMTQPPLSRQLQRLERELGVELFLRSRRGISLTAAGTALLPEARALLAGADRAATVARDAAEGRHGTLRIGFVGSASFSLLPRVLRRYREQAPDVRLVLEERTTAAQLRELRAGRLDVGLGTQPQAAPDLVVEPIGREPLVAIVAAGHRLAGEQRISLAALAGEPFVLYPRGEGPGMHDLTLGLCAEAGFTPEISQEAVQMATIVSLVAGGLGVSVVPAAVAALRRDDVRYLELEEQTAAITTVVAYRESTPVVERFVAAVVAEARAGR